MNSRIGWTRPSSAIARSSLLCEAVVLGGALPAGIVDLPSGGVNDRRRVPTQRN
jgi:hypothetical protein